MYTEYHLSATKSSSCLESDRESSIFARGGKWGSISRQTALGKLPG